MPKLSNVCSHVRSKNAGPFWITVDLFFPDAGAFAHYSNAPSLTGSAIAAVFGVDPVSMKRFEVTHLSVLKFSYPRATPQGGTVERDMHGGQQYVRLLDVEL
ncbi:uncharacterized protein DUF4387 [Sphingomonas sp. PP-CE-1A-559]|uniref:DUF4387 domain-containing protein n=1 Tax=Sphingomonas sp. PP-CE-1A-559 TaxID=2135657 RepID=UPI001055236F|nr:DUF4387 domain-containing protein [Sphingomonas sp. PP-CE-1A-559]TCP82854.1 uncharacterized protein DUF4387 [Sphingomonas sp. PP-CE-1A-559]